jgi:hypothetical protein
MACRARCLVISTSPISMSSSGLSTYRDDLNLSRPGEQRHGISDRTSRDRTAIPRDEHGVELERPIMNIGHCNDRPAGSKQDCFIRISDCEPKTIRLDMIYRLVQLTTALRTIGSRPISSADNTDWT